MRASKLGLIFIALTLSSLTAAPTPASQLGTVSFPISCSAGVQKPFERGVALLHSFEYNAAAAQFREIERQEPGCAMAYWGDAMSLYHQLWDRPSKTSLEEGAALVHKAEAASPKTARERGYLHAAAAFYDNPNIAYDARAQAYSQALGQLHKQFPRDDEAAAFYALSLIASPHSSDNNFASHRQAVAILNGIFARHPNHPGAAHYLIHACDNPQMAAEGLAAARRYAEIAPASAHAIHMPSHIFARLGLWHDDVQSNIASKRTAEQQHETAARLHAMGFLQYAYLQLGDFTKAKAVETEAGECAPERLHGRHESLVLLHRKHTFRGSTCSKRKPGKMPNLCLSSPRHHPIWQSKYFGPGRWPPVISGTLPRQRRRFTITTCPSRQCAKPPMPM